MTVAGTCRGAGAFATMLTVTLFVTVVAAPAAVSAGPSCNFSADMNATSNTLLLTCTCKATPRNFQLLRLHINKNDSYAGRVPLAWVKSNNVPTMVKNAQNFEVSRTEFSETRNHALIELAFDLHYNRNDWLGFECIAASIDNFHDIFEKYLQLEIKSSDYYYSTSTAAARTISSNIGSLPVERVTGGKSQLSIEMLAMVITLPLVIVSLIVCIIVILTVRCQRQNAVPAHLPTPCGLRPDNGVPSDVVRHLMAMSSATRGHCRHPTPSSSLHSLSTSGSNLSGSYAVCLTTPTISVCNLHVGSSDDASIRVTRQSNVPIGDEVMSC